MSLHRISLVEYGITCGDILRNAPPARLYEDAVLFDAGAVTSSGALSTSSYEKTGRSPKDKRIVDNPESRDDIWWGPVNIAISPESFRHNRRRAIDYLSLCRRVYVVDGYAGWDEQHRIKVRVICSRPYHALFMHNMLIRPTEHELAQFGEPDYVIFNAGAFKADPDLPDVASTTSVSLDFETGEFVILGTQYAGEMKKGVFTIMHYLMPKRGVLSMHCSANEGQGGNEGKDTNEGKAGDVSLFFGLSGTGKTTLSADPRRRLIGDDEHCWTDRGVFNIEGGCYAKCLGLSAESEPEIFSAVRFGSVLENTVFDPHTRVVDYNDDSLTQNTRASYPIEFIPNAKAPCLGGHPRNIVLLTCDAFGVLPPVSRLSPEQAMYHFISGYTAKVAGTEVGVNEPEATFSACYGAAFLVWHPTKYAEMLAQRMKRHGTSAWLVNTGWCGGAYGVGRRMKLAHTRAIVDAIHAGALDDVKTVEDPIFGLQIPLEVPGCPREVLVPSEAWEDAEAYDATARKLAALFHKNFSQYADEASEGTKSAGPRVPVGAGA
jgi:phosphoenolpyruvate carboxykinase (ATP)